MATPLKLKNNVGYPSRSALLDITPIATTDRKSKGINTSNTEVVHHQFNIEKSKALFYS
jgi:hypothetical protein